MLLKNSNHILSIVVIFILACILFHKSFFEPGQLLYVDMLFPSSLDRTLELSTTLWNPYGISSSLAIVPRLPWMLFFILPSQILALSMERFLLLLFISTLFITGFSIYLLTYHLLRDSLGGDSRRWLFSFASLVSSFLYMYNPLSLGLFWAYGFFPTYALLPLILLFGLLSFERDKPIYIISTSFLAMLGSTSVHSAIWILILIFLLFLYRFIVTTHSGGKRASIKTFGLIAVLYVLLSAFWFLPTLYTQSYGDLGPPYEFTRGMLDHLSKNSGPINAFRLIPGTRFAIDPSFIGEEIATSDIPEITAMLRYTSFTNPLNVTNPLWICLGFLSPIMAFSSLLLFTAKKVKKILIFFGGLSLISLFLSFGTNSPFPQVYEWLSFDAPFSSSFGFLLRAPYRWLIFTSLSFSVMFSFSMIKISELARNLTGHIRLNKLLAVLAISLIITGTSYFVYPVVKFHSDHIFSPAEVPEEYSNLNVWLSNQDGDFKVLWLPGYPPCGYFPSWAEDKRIGPYSIVSSDRESISSYLSIVGTRYFDWLERSVVYPIRPIWGMAVSPAVYKNSESYSIEYLGRLLAPLGVKYIILDTSVKNSLTYPYAQFDISSDIRPFLENSADISLAYEDNFLYVYQNLSYVYPRVHVTQKTAQVRSNLEMLVLSQTQQNFSEIAIAITNEDVITGSININWTNLVKNPSFEMFTPADMPDYWYKDRTDRYTVTLDDTTKWSGEYSLKVETHYFAGGGRMAGWVMGENIEVTPGDWYLFESHMKWNNIAWVHSVIYGYNTNTGGWEQLVHNPSIRSGQSDWKEYRCVFKIPDGITKIQPRLGIGWVQDDQIGNGVVWFDDINIYKPEIMPCESENGVNLMDLKKIRSTKYIVNVEASAPFMLSFAESYDPLWAAYVNGKEYKSMPLYSVINGFWIDEAGELEITIEYKSQRWFYYGSAVTLLTIIGCALYLAKGSLRRLISKIHKRRFFGL